ncbi:MAG: pitrilysin family protein [Candidatus Kapaibacterium sp.]
MKKYILTAVLTAFLTAINIFSNEINPDVKPEPLGSTGFNFPEYTVKTLSNGLKVYVIQDKEQPTVAFRLLVAGGTSMDGTKSGLAEMTAAMMTKGTKNRTAQQIAAKADGLGIGLTSSATTDYYSVFAEGLKKHQDVILDLMSDILLNPTFPIEEFKKIQQQMIAGIQYDKSSSTNLAQGLARIAVYGKNHPYGANKSEQSISSIDVNDLTDFHKKWIKPNNATLAVVGDVEPDDIVKELEKFFKPWEKSDAPAIEIPEPTSMPKGIYFIARNGSVQTSIAVSSLTVPYKHLDYDGVNLASKLIGGSNGRLFNTLREKYSFTYSPYGYQTSSKYANRFTAIAEVNKSKTDSSISVILGELRDIINNTPDDDELNRVKISHIGNYQMSFENSLFIASLIQNEEFYGKQINGLKNYTKKISSLIPSDITSAVRNYINPDNAMLVVVGDTSILPSISKYGQIFKYDSDYNPLEGKDAELTPISMSAEKLISNYEKAIGGTANVEKLQTLNIMSIAELSFNGQTAPGQVLTQKKTGTKMYNSSDFGLFKNEIWVDGENVYSSQNGGESIPQEGGAKEKALFEAEMFPVLSLKKYGYTLEVLGKQGSKILLSARDKGDAETIYYFNTDNYLLDKTEMKVVGPNETLEVWSIVYEDYREFDGIKLPGIQRTISPSFTINLRSNYELNKEIADEVFVPQK